MSLVIARDLSVVSRPNCQFTVLNFRDHAGGTKELQGLFGGKLKIYGGDDRIESLTNKVADNQKLQVIYANIFPTF